MIVARFAHTRRLTECDNMMVYDSDQQLGVGDILQNRIHDVHRSADPTPSWIGALGLAIAVGIAFFFGAQLGLALQPDGVAVFWPAAGVSGILIALGRDARLPVVGGVMAATVVANLIGDRNVWSAIAFAFFNAGEAVLMAWLIERYFGSPFNLDRLRNVLGLLAAAVIATAVAGSGGTLAYKLFHAPTAPFWTTWHRWFASDAVGIITVAPMVIGLADALREPPPRNEIIEGVGALVVLSVTTAILVFLPPEPWKTVRPIGLLFPVLAWLAARCRPGFAATAVFIVSLAIIWTITFGIGHFRILALPIDDRIAAGQAAILIVAVGTYFLAALFAERRQHVRMLKEGQALLQEALAAGEVLAFECNPVSGLVKRSDNAAQIMGFDPLRPLTAAQFRARIHPDDLAGFEAHDGRDSIDSPATVTFRFVRPDGREVWLEETSRAEFDAAGRLLRLKGLTRDITRRKQSEKRQNLLSAELDHRVKNVLARVAAVVSHTRRGSGTSDEFVNALNGRIQSIAAAHALLSQKRWEGVNLADLMRQQLAPYTTEANTTTIRGPEVTLTSTQTQALATVIHELVTNAAKHGALCSPDGRVSVSWDRAGDDGSVTLTIAWRELDGPPITAPVQSGYGLSLIRDLIPHELGGTVDLTFPPEGVCCKIEIPLWQR